MYRTMLGVLVGASCGILVAYLVVWWHAAVSYRGTDDGAVLMLGGVLAAMWALTGAVVGGVGDIVAFLRRLHPNLPRTGPEAHYRERV
jgi:hypothetical protein